MEGSKMQSVRLQLSLIQNEKERLLTCLDGTIQRALSLCGAEPSAVGSLMRDNNQLLSLLTDWADTAESRLAKLYPCDVTPPAVNGTGCAAAPAEIHSGQLSPAGPAGPPTAVSGPAGPPTAVSGPAGPRGSVSPRPVSPVVARSAAGSQLTVASRPAAPGRQPPPAGRDQNTTCESVTSFYTAAGGAAGSASPLSLVNADTASRPQRIPDQAGDRAMTPLTAEPSPPHVSKMADSRKSSGQASCIVSRHLRKKKNTPEPPKEVTQKPLASGVETPVMFSCHDDLTGYTYLNLREDEAALAQLTDQLTALALHPARVSRTPKQGELVMAAWQGAWYRARVTQVFDGGDTASSTVALQYIDYGNTDQQLVSRVSFLPDTAKEAPAAAYKCKLTNLRVGGASHWPLQRQVLLALADCADCRLTAVFRRSPLPGLYEAALASLVSVDGKPVQADVVATVNSVLLMDPIAIARQTESDVLALRPLLVPFRRPEAAPVASTAEQPAEEKVRSWLAGQSRSSTQTGPASRASRTATARSSRETADLDMSFASAESRPARARRYQPPAPAQYKGLELVWTARPIEQPLAGAGPHNVLMLQIYDPGHFYLGIRTQQFDAFEARLTALYSRLPLHPDQAVRHMLLPGSYWVARWQQQGAEPRWCRCVILEDQAPTDDQEASAPADYPVLWVDYGDTARLAAASFRPMTEEFAAEPLFAVRARCAGVYPVNELGAPIASYTAEAAKVFQSMLKDRACEAVPVPSESTPGCLAVVLEAMLDAELFSVTEALQELHIAALRWPELDAAFAPELESESRQAAATPASSPEKEIAQWDPMTEDFVSPYNRPEEVQEGAEVGGLTAREDPDQQPVCPVYARGARCWDGIACPKRHVRGGDQVPDTVLVHVANPESVVLPPRGCTVYVKPSAVVSPQQFYVQLPFGAIPAQDVNSDHAGYRRQLQEEETLESLSAALAAGYRDSRRQHYSAACRPALGEVVVAPWQAGWHRGLVTDLTERLQPHQLLVEVFLVDHGVTLTCNAEKLREIKKEYNLLPYQAVQCSLGLVSPVGGAGWSDEAVARFVQLVSRPCLLATVLGRHPDGHLELDLFEGPRQLARVLVQEGLAARRPGAQPTAGRPLPR